MKKIHIRQALTIWFFFHAIGAAKAVNYWFDTDGVTAGFGVADGGVYDWTTALTWNTDATGGAGTPTTWPGGSNQAFMTGAGAGTTYTVRLGAAGADNITLQNFAININAAVNGASGSGNVTIGNPGDTGILTLNAANSFGAHGGGVLIVNNGINANGFTTHYRGGNVTLNGVLSGAGASALRLASGAFNLTSGTLTLTGDNTYAGATTIESAYVLKILHANALGGTATGTTVNSGGALEVAGGIVSNAGESISIAGPSTANVGALRAGAGGGTWAGQVTLADIAVRLGALAGQTLTITGAIVDGGGTGFNISGQSGTGVVVLNPAVANTYTGTSGIIRGILRLGKTDALPTGTILDVDSVNTVTDAATFDLAGFNQTVAALQDSATTDIGGKITNSLAASTSTLRLNQALNTSFNGIIEDGAGTVVLTKGGSGNLTLNAANTFTGGLNIENGRVILGAGNDRLAATGSVVLGGPGTSGVLVLGDGTARNQTLAGLTTTGNGGSVVGGAAANSTLTLNIAAGSQTFSGTLGGAGANENNLVLTKTGAGSLALTSPNTLVGNVNVQNGVLTAADPSAFGAAGRILNLGTSSTTGTVDFATDTTVNAHVINIGSGNTGTVRVNRASPGAAITHVMGLPTLGNATLNVEAGANVTSGSPVLEFSGLTLSAGATGFGTTTINPTTAIVSVTGPVTRPGTLANSLTLGGTIAGNTVTGVISGALAVTKSGASTWTLSNANTHTGVTKVNGGSLILTNDLALQNSPYDPSGAGTLDLTATNAPTLGGLISATNLVLPANVTSLTLNNTTGAGLSYTGSLSGGAAGLTLVKSGTNSQILAGPNTYSGTTTVSGGLLGVGHSNALGSTVGDTVVNGGAALRLSGGVTVSGETIRIAGNGGTAPVGNFNGALQADAGATAVWDGPVIINSTDARVGAVAGGTLELRGPISDGGVNNVLNVGAGLGGTGAVVVTAAAGTNTYTGSTIITRGILRIGAHNTLPAATLLDIDNANAAENAILDLNGFNQSVGGLQRTNVGGGAGGSIITNQGGADSTLTVDQSVATSFGGIIQDGTTHAVRLVKKGSGTLTLSAYNTYNGTTSVEGGVLRVNGMHSGAGLINVSSGATLGGSGSVSSNVNVTDAVLSPGAADATAGTFTVLDLSLTPASVLAFDLASPFTNDGDFLSVVGNLPALAGSLNINPLVGFDAPSIVAGDKWLLASYGGTPLGSHSLTMGTAPALSGGLSYAIDISQPNEIYLTVVVPEAGSAGLLAAGLLLLLRRLRPRA